jgi:hypothetical protein
MSAPPRIVVTEDGTEIQNDAEARYQRTRRRTQYIGLAADIVIRIGGEFIRTIIR